MATRTPEVSVVIPTRNRWHRLSRTLSGALSQHGVDLEVIVVDDCSDDQTPERLREVNDPRIRTIRHEQRRNLAAARNTGVSAAAGRWLAFLDDDDLWSPLKLRRQLDTAAVAEAAFAFAGCLTVDDDGVVLRTAAPPDPDRVMELLLAGDAIPAGASNVIARTERVRDLGGFDPELRHFADWDMWLRLAATARAAACDQPLLAYVLHGDNMVFTDSRGVVREFRRMAAKHELLAGGYGVTPDRIVPDRMGVFRWLGWGNARMGRRFKAAGWYALGALGSSPYGRRRSLADARLALFGRLAGRGPRSIDPAMVEAATWLRDYRFTCSGA
jgi:glycosyltransferase involved in cell wall biosynthesis